MSLPTTRFAPSPTGLLHLGHAYSALLASDWSRTHRGRFLLRMEDIDSTRCKPEFEAGIIEDLQWLNIAWDGPIIRQSERLLIYDDARSNLESAGVLYRCFRTRKQILDEIARAPHTTGEGPEGIIFTGAPLPEDEQARRMKRGEQFAWRLSIKAARQQLNASQPELTFEELTAEPTGQRTAQPEMLGDVILARKDLGVAYHLATTIDDAAQGVTHIIRGEDLLPSTHVHRLLQALLNLPTPTYGHHPLILDANGKRYAKRDASVTLKALRENGKTPADIRAMIGLS